MTTVTTEESNGVLKVNFEQAASAPESTHLAVDLGNLCVVDPSPLDKAAFGANPKQALYDLTRDNAQALFDKLFSLPTAPPPDSEPGVIADLPPPMLHLPRAKPVPKPKEPTKWELFAAQKGIVKRKKSALVWDEDRQEYLRRWGYKKANDPMRQWAIEHKDGADPAVDPWTKMKSDKKERVEKNKKAQEKNLKAATGQRLPGTLDLTTAVEAKASKKGQKKKKEKSHVDVALELAQGATASMGKFDKKRSDEPERKTKKKIVKRDAEFARDHSAEKNHQMGVLSKLLGKVTEKESFDGDKAVSGLQQKQEAVNRKRKASSGKGGSAKGGKSSKGSSSKGGKGGKGGSAKGGKGKSSSKGGSSKGKGGPKRAKKGSKKQ